MCEELKDLLHIYNEQFYSLLIGILLILSLQIKGATARSSRAECGAIFFCSRMAI